MATTNYNLPTITGNMAVDVVRDMNALAEAADGAIKRAVDGVDLSTVTQQIGVVDQRVTTHLAESNANAHKATSISFAPPTGMTATTLQDAMTEVFQGYSSKISDLVDQLLLIDPSLPISYSSTMQEILTALTNQKIVKGKRFQTGTINSQSTVTTFVKYDGSAINNFAVTVTGLPFTPATVVIQRNNTSFPQITTVSKLNPKLNGFDIIALLGDQYRLTGNAFLSTNGFQLPVSTGNVAYTWVAYE